MPGLQCAGLLGDDKKWQEGTLHGRGVEPLRGLPGGGEGQEQVVMAQARICDKPGCSKSCAGVLCSPCCGYCCELRWDFDGARVPSCWFCTAGRWRRLVAYIRANWNLERYT